MFLKNLSNRLREWIELNVDFFSKSKKNYKYSKRQDVLFDSNLINNIKNNFDPVFVLSTGRCGTEYLTKILGLSDQTQVYHSPHPELILASKAAYKDYEKNEETHKRVVESARIELILDAYLRNKKFIETNNKITFFAHALSSLFPKSKFIHLVRHPGNFVTSGLNRKWYQGFSNHDLGRILPKQNDIDFEKYNSIEKISWLWNETNEYIEKFKDSLDDSSRCITIKAENLFGNKDTINFIYNFIGCEHPSENKLNGVLKKVVNVQRGSSIPKYSEWEELDKEYVKKFCTLAKKYDYELT